MSFEFANYTPFPPVHFESVDHRLNHLCTAVLRGTFKIQHGEPLQLVPEQQGIVYEDQYIGDPMCSSMLVESSLIPYKPRTDLLLVRAVAYSPSGDPERYWTCSLSFGQKRKKFQVTGPNQWGTLRSVNRLKSCQPIESLPLMYEYSYGGQSSSNANIRFKSNPAGVGYPGSDSELTCPQIIPNGATLLERGRAIEPVGVGPVAPSWDPRLSCMGTIDEQWKGTRAPYLPEDFSYEYYSSAPHDQTFDGFAIGDEWITLENLSPERILTFRLPEIKLITLVELGDGRIIPSLTHLDTIEVDVEEKLVFLSWRSIFPAYMPLRRVEIRMSAPKSLIEQ